MRRRELGSLLQQYREASGLAVKEVAEQLLCHPSKISRIESGQRAASVRDIRDLCNIYQIADTAMRDHMMLLAREARQHGWWQDYDLDSPASTYVGLEAAAIRMSNFESSIVPGLLQSPAYTAAVLRAVRPQLTPHQVEQAVEARLKRQENARQNGVELWTVLDEAVLHRASGGSAVMREQLDHLIESASAPNTVVQVITFQAGAHLGMNSTFIMLDFLPPLSSVIFVEGLVGSIYLEKDADIVRYRKAFDRLRAIASSVDDSLDLIVKVRDRYHA